MNQLLLEFKKLDNSIIRLMRNGIKFSFMISIISTIILFTYHYLYASPNLYYIGISLFKTSLFFIVAFIIGGFAFNKIKNEII